MQAVLADIGSDHCHLPAALIQRQQVQLAYALDLSSKALNSARSQLNAAEMSGLCLRASDGTDGLTDEECVEVSCISMAGMGGILMLDVLWKALERCKSLDRLVLQANRDRLLLRREISQLGWRLLAEEMVQRFQTLVWVRGDEPLTPRQCALGPRFLETRPTEWLQWLQREQARLEGIKFTAGEGMPERLHQQLGWISELLSSDLSCR